MTNQEAFTKVVQHLRTQGTPSVIRSHNGFSDVCAYRHPDGIRQCAVGILIPDEAYSPEIEGKTYASLLDKGSTPPIIGVSIDLLFTLQAAHDHEAYDTNPDSPWAQRMESRYHEIAAAYSLTIPPHPLSSIDNTQESLEVPCEHNQPIGVESVGTTTSHSLARG